MLEMSDKDLAPCPNCGCLLRDTYYRFLSHQSKCPGLKISKKTKVLDPKPEEILKPEEVFKPEEDECPACFCILKYPHQPHNCPGW